MQDMLRAATMSFGLIMSASTCISAVGQSIEWETYVDAGRSEYGRGDYEKAVRLFQAATSEAERTQNGPQLAVSLSELAKVYAAQGKYDQAAALYNRALQIAEAANDPDQRLVAAVLTNWANVYRNQGKFDEAAQLNTRALAILENTLGRDDETVATVINNLAMVYVAGGKYEQAE